MTNAQLPPFLPSTFYLLPTILLGFALRLHYLTTTHPFYDEYTTVLAARETWRHGWPLLPSGLFDEHGLLATYLIAPFTALFIDTPLIEWQAAHWQLMLARWPSLLLSTVTIPLIFVIGRRGFGRPEPALFAALLFALSPEGMVWGGRARMYALATLLVLLTVATAYRGLTRQSVWWLSLGWLLLALLTQLGVLLLIPPLLLAIWVFKIDPTGTSFASKNLSGLKQSLAQLTTLGLIIGVALFVKRLGQPLGTDPLIVEESSNSPLWSELFNTIAYQVTLHFTWADTEQFLARQFGVPHLYGLTIATLIGLGICLIIPFFDTPTRRKAHLVGGRGLRFTLFLSLIFGLIILEVVTLLEPFRRNPRYLVMYLPLFYLIIGYSLYTPLAWAMAKIVPNGATAKAVALRQIPHLPPTAYRRWATAKAVALLPHLPPTAYRRWATAKAVALRQILPLLPPTLYLLLTVPPSINLALQTPEPAYEEAFAYVQQHWQTGDTLLTMNTPAAEIYGGHLDGFAVERDAEQFLLTQESGQVDRWLGVEWVGTARQFYDRLTTGERVWFVSDTIRQPVYYGGAWQAVLVTHMEQVWAHDNALVYRSKPAPTPLALTPQITVSQILGERIELVGYSWQISPPSIPPSGAGSLSSTENCLATATQPSPLPLPAGGELEEVPPLGGFRGADSQKEACLDETKSALTSPVPSGGGTTTSPSPLPAGGQTGILTLFWQPLRPLEVDYTLFVHLRDEANQTVSQHDGQPFDGLYPTSRWPVSDVVPTPISLTLPDDAVSDEYTFAIGLYDLATLQRLPVRDDTSGENAVLLR